jgi:hypothetical protein
VRVVAGWQGEPLRGSWRYINDQSGMFPDLILTAVNIKRATSQLSQEHVAIADEQFTVREAQGEAAITAAARLKEHERTPCGSEACYRLQGRFGRHDAGNRSTLSHQKNPDAMV